MTPGIPIGDHFYVDQIARMRFLVFCLTLKICKDDISSLLIFDQKLCMFRILGRNFPGKN